MGGSSLFLCYGAPRLRPTAIFRRWAYSLVVVCSMYVLLAQLAKKPSAEIKANRLPSTIDLEWLWQYDSSNHEPVGRTLMKFSSDRDGGRASKKRARRKAETDTGAEAVTELPFLLRSFRTITNVADGELKPTAPHDRDDDFRGRDRNSADVISRRDLSPTTRAVVARSKDDSNLRRRRNDLTAKSVVHRPSVEGKGRDREYPRGTTAYGLQDGDDEDDDYLVNLLLPYKDDGEEEDYQPTEPVAVQWRRFFGADKERQDGVPAEGKPVTSPEFLKNTFKLMEEANQRAEQSEQGTKNEWKGQHEVARQQVRGGVVLEEIMKKDANQLPLRQSVQRNYTIAHAAWHGSPARPQDVLYRDKSSAPNPDIVLIDRSAGEVQLSQQLVSVQTADRRFKQKPRVLYKPRPAWIDSPRAPPIRRWPLLKVSDVPINKSPSCSCVLLVIIFNGAHYGNIPFLLRYYRHGFKHIVFYGPVGRRFPPIPHLHPKEIVVHATVDKTGGYYQQWTLAQVMTNHPMYDGYLWVGDDVYLNYPQLLTTMDPTKFWLNSDIEVNGIFRGFRYDWSDPNMWNNWIRKFGIQAIRRVYKEIPHRIIQKMKSTFGKADTVIKSFSDVGYIPRAFVKDTVSLFYNLRYAIFEIAIPTACYLVSTPNDRQNFSKAVYLWYDGKRRHPGDFIDADTTFLHPVKYSLLQNRRIATRWLRYQKQKYNFGKSPPKNLRC